MAALTIAMFVAGCGGSSDRSASTGATKQATPPAAATRQPLSKGREVSAATVRKLLAKEKAKALRHATRKAPSGAAGSLAQVAKKGIARQIIMRLSAGRRGHDSPVGRRLKKAIGHLLAQGKAEGGGSPPSSGLGAKVVQEIARRAEEGK